MQSALDSPQDLVSATTLRALAASTIPLRTTPGDEAGWTNLEALTDPDWWRDIADRYSRHIGTSHTAIGGVCALQHYSGRLLQPVVEIFPNPAAFLRLATSVVIDQHDEWQVSRRYLSETSMAELRRVIAAKRRALDTGNDYDQSRLVDHCA